MRTAANEELKNEQREVSGADDSRGKARKGKPLMKKRTRITVVTRQTVVARSLRVRCPECGAEVPVITSKSAAGVLQTSPHEIQGLLASGDLHAVAEESGASRICGNSISATSTDNGIPIEGERQ
jgi:hypothetical protein